MAITRKRNVTLLGAVIAALVLLTLLLPVLATSGDYGMTSGGSVDPTATPNPPTATQAPPTATSVPPTAVPTSALSIIVQTIAPQCPQGYSYDVTVKSMRVRRLAP